MVAGFVESKVTVYEVVSPVTGRANWLEAKRAKQTKKTRFKKRKVFLDMFAMMNYAVMPQIERVDALVVPQILQA